MPNPTSTSKTLNEAADLIEEYGWIQGSRGNPAVGFCAVGAIAYTLTGDSKPVDLPPAFWHACRFMEEWLKTNGHSCRLMIIPWNDTGGRTASEVVDGLRAAARSARHRDVV